MSRRRIALGLDSFSLHLHYESGRFDVFQFLDLVDQLELEGVQINLNGPRNRHLSGDTPEHYERLRSRLGKRPCFVELASAGTDPERLSAVLDLCSYLGGDLVRTVIGAGGEIEEELAAAPGNLRKVAERAARLGVRVAIENHEDLSATQLAELVQQVDSEWLAVLFDVGNSLVLGEDPLAAARILAPYTVSVHLKDQVIVEAEDGLRSAGTRLGAGAIDLPAIVEVLLRDSSCDRMLVQLCYGYSQRLRTLDGWKARSSAEDLWKPRPAPHDPDEVLLPEHLRNGIDEEIVLMKELEHLEASVRYARELLVQ